jgi:hypothetical protein
MLLSALFPYECVVHKGVQRAGLKSKVVLLPKAIVAVYMQVHHPPCVTACRSSTKKHMPDGIRYYVFWKILKGLVMHVICCATYQH